MYMDEDEDGAAAIKCSRPPPLPPPPLMSVSWFAIFPQLRTIRKCIMRGDFYETVGAMMVHQIGVVARRRHLVPIVWH